MGYDFEWVALAALIDYIVYDGVIIDAVEVTVEDELELMFRTVVGM